VREASASLMISSTTTKMLSELLMSRVSIGHLKRSDGLFTSRLQSDILSLECLLTGDLLILNSSPLAPVSWGSKSTNYFVY
jgi:hypothetical protein